MPEPTLNSIDQVAFDALLEAEFDLTRVPPEVRERAERVAKVLGLLDVPAVGTTGDPARTSEDKRTLVDVTMARVLRSGAVEAEPALNWNDEEALDTWLMGAGASGTRGARVARHEALASLVTRTGLAEATSGRDAMIERTFDACMARGEQTYKIDRFRGANVRVADVASVAAVLTIGAAMLWPLMTGMRDQARRYACTDNLRGVAGGMGLYAGANQDSLPVVTAGLGGGKWWEVGSPDGRSNSRNLFHLAKTGFTKLANLACPGNPSACTSIEDQSARDWRNLDEVSYSYRIMRGEKHPQWNHDGRVVILTDRSPVVRRAVRGEAINPWENSPNHNGRGQKVMLSDGSVTWYRRPELDNGDNIWLPYPIEQLIGDVTGREVRLEGTEFPASARDAFVGP